MSDTLRLYRGVVVHRRLSGPRHRFRYRVFSLLVDLDRLAEADRSLRLFSHNRFNAIGFNDRDHGPKDGTPLRPWIDARLAGAGIDLAGGRVRLLCYPRVLGYVFNPLSLWFCEHADGTLRAVLCEVRNTFGEWHGYLLHRDGIPMDWPVRDRAAKCFHVSPLLPRRGHYRFRFSEPGAAYQMAVAWHDDAADTARPTLVAVQTGRAQRLSDANLLRNLLGVPLMTVKVMAAIHWQALRLWLRGARFHRKPPPPVTEITR